LTWLVLDRDCVPKGEGSLPAGQRVVATDGRLLVTTEKDSLEVECLVVYRIRK